MPYYGENDLKNHNLRYDILKRNLAWGKIKILKKKHIAFGYIMLSNFTVPKSAIKIMQSGKARS